MLLLLPPSEGKTSPADDDGTRLDLQALSMPELSPARQRVMDALSEVSASESAQSVLKVGARAMDEVAANTRLRELPAAPARQVYTGVLYEALDPDSLTSAQLKAASQRVLVFSGLFGVTGFGDRIPAYRCAMDVKLPQLGNLGTFWKKQMIKPMSEFTGDHLLIDCRSGTYRKPFPGDPANTLQVNNFTEHQGSRKVVTHFAKAARGELTGMLLRSETPLKTVDEVAHIASERWRVEIRQAEGRTPQQLDLISTD